MNLAHLLLLGSSSGLLSTTRTGISFGVLRQREMQEWYRGIRHHRTWSRPADRRVAALDVQYVGRIQKILLNIDESLVSEANGHRVDPASLMGERFVIDKNVPLSAQQQITVESPRNADVVTLQVGSSVRRTDKQQDNGLLLAMVDTVTLNRESAEAIPIDSRSRRFGTAAHHLLMTETTLPHSTFGAVRFRSTPRRRSDRQIRLPRAP